MFSKLLIIILLASINNSKEFNFNIFQMRDGYKQVMDQFQLMETSGQPNREAKWIQQPLDHFDLNNNKYWNMRYFENFEFWKEDGPIYILLGGAEYMSDHLLTTGLMYDLAEETNGGMYATEHRYYGESKPVSGTTAEDYKFLSAGQALIDVLNLVYDIKSNFTKSKIVVVGESYAGNLAAWMRESYPDYVDAALASSAPVLAKKDFYEYFEKVGDDYEYSGGEDCINKIKHIFNRYEMLFNSTAGIEQLKAEENICDSCDMTVPEAKYFFFYRKISDISRYPQYKNIYDIKHHCEKLNGSNLDIQSFWNARNSCDDYSFENMIKDMKDDGGLAWAYQSCNEFGYFTTTTSKSQPFTKNLPLEFFIKICTALFGKEFNEERVDKGVEKTNNLYGGLSPKYVTQVVFSNGEMDPWSKLGIVKDLSDKVPAVVIPNATYCRDLRPSRYDNEAIVEAREHIKSIIKKWINAS